MTKVLRNVYACLAMLLMVNIVVFMPVKAYANGCMSADAVLEAVERRGERAVVLSSAAAKSAGEGMVKLGANLKEPMTLGVVIIHGANKQSVHLGTGTMLCVAAYAWDAAGVKKMRSALFGEGE